MLVGPSTFYFFIFLGRLETYFIRNTGKVCLKCLKKPCFSCEWTSIVFLSPSLQANIKEMEVTIPAKLHNSLIGSKGCLVRSIMDDCGGVHIHFPSEGSGSDKVTIRGPAGEVEKAKKQLLQLAEEKVGGEGKV